MWKNGRRKRSIRIILTNNIQEAKQISERLNQYNIERQETEKQIFKQAIQEIEEENKDVPCIILGKKDGITEL